ncbi:thioredoxin [Chitinophaga sp. NPDC101104]|uniref:thioredoxin n=1 Tax=Chitinophaga sp. NPDC101104 TaxID=3390561 RepID=UPI003D0892BA
MSAFNDLIQSEQPVLVDFYADWCQPCHAMTPVIKEVAQAVEGKARVVKVNIDKNQQAASHFNVSAVPTFIIFRKGEIVWRHAGMIDKGSLLRQLQAASA